MPVIEAVRAELVVRRAHHVRPEPVEGRTLRQSLS